MLWHGKVILRSSTTCLHLRNEGFNSALPSAGLPWRSHVAPPSGKRVRHARHEQPAPRVCGRIGHPRCARGTHTHTHTDACTSACGRGGGCTTQLGLQLRDNMRSRARARTSMGARTHVSTHARVRACARVRADTSTDMRGRAHMYSRCCLWLACTDKGKESGHPESNQGPSYSCTLYSQMLYQLSYSRLVALARQGYFALKHHMSTSSQRGLQLRASERGAPLA